jgi:nucleoid-associated protein YgaU
MNLFVKKVLYLALFMIVAVGFQSFAADLVGDWEDARVAVAEAEREYAEKEAAYDAAKNSVINAKADLDAAEAALADARTALEIARAAEAEALAKVEAVEAEYAAEMSADTPTPPPAATGGGSADTPPPAATGGGSTDTPPPAATGGGSTGTTPPATADTRPPVPITPTDRGEIPDSIRRNQYYLESERYLALAQNAYNAGDYDTATEYAEEAARLARLSDEYIAQQTGVLPATYTVREWDVHGDCFWNIAGQPWAYNDPYRWRVLYEANKEKLPDPNNANIVEPGTVLTIPSIQGETRQGEWVGGRTYEPLR